MQKKLREIHLFGCFLNCISLPDITLTLTNVVATYCILTPLGKALQVNFNSYEDMLTAQEITSWDILETENALLTYMRDNFIHVGQYRFCNFDTNEIGTPCIFNTQMRRCFDEYGN